MEQHPVPQNVTTFQFRLIGDMTIKQFGYLAGGAILAYICYKLPLPFFFTWPLALICALGGFGFAFVPIEERPMDVWVLSFFKSIYSPTQYTWKQELLAEQASPAVKAGPVSPAASPTSQPAQIPSPTINNLPPNPLPVVHAPVMGPFDMISSLFKPKPTFVKPPATIPPAVSARMDFTPPPAVQTSAQKQELEKAKLEQQELETKMKSLQTELQGKTVAESRVLELQNQLTELLSEREHMSKELAALRAETPATPIAAPIVDTSMPPPKTTSSVSTPTLHTGPNIQIVTPDQAVKVGIPRLTTFPNVVTGIIKDSENGLLPGVLVTLKDAEGVPLRALKTNRLGQFAASTPLPNGTYFIEIEDPRSRFTFDRAQITLAGGIVPAIQVFAKSQKEITRAKLEKELFGNKN